MLNSEHLGGVTSTTITVPFSPLLNPQSDWRRQEIEKSEMVGLDDSWFAPERKSILQYCSPGWQIHHLLFLLSKDKAEKLPNRQCLEFGIFMQLCLCLIKKLFSSFFLGRLNLQKKVENNLFMGPALHFFL